jgi:hypothetical protein
MRRRKSLFIARKFTMRSNEKIRRLAASALRRLAISETESVPALVEKT